MLSTKRNRQEQRSGRFGSYGGQLLEERSLFSATPLPFETCAKHPRFRDLHSHTAAAPARHRCFLSHRGATHSLCQLAAHSTSADRQLIFSCRREDLFNRMRYSCERAAKHCCCSAAANHRAFTTRTTPAHDASRASSTQRELSARKSAVHHAGWALLRNHRRVMRADASAAAVDVRVLCSLKSTTGSCRREWTTFFVLSSQRRPALCA